MSASLADLARLSVSLLAAAPCRVPAGDAPRIRPDARMPPRAARVSSRALSVA